MLYHIPQYTATLACEEASKPARADEVRRVAAVAKLNLKEAIVSLSIG